MTQPAASKLLKEPEDALGVPLFDRLPRGMRATACGETMIRHARQALSSLAQAHEEIQALKSGRLGQVSVGAISAPGLNLMPAAIARVKAQHPGLRVHLAIESSDLLMERLAQGRLEMVVGRLFESHDKSDLRYETLAEDPVCAIVRPGHALLANARLTLRDLVPQAWIVPPAGEALAVIATDVARYCAQHGMVAILSIALPCKVDAFGLVTRSDRLPSPGAKLMLQAIRTAALTVYGAELALA